MYTNDGDGRTPPLAAQGCSPLTAVAQVAVPESPIRLADFMRNSLLSVGRLLVSTAIVLILPGYLTHRLSVASYGAWVLILQLSAYVDYFNFGIQTAISKYVAEYEARDDERGASMHASAGLALTLISGLLGAVLTVILAFQVPRLFHEMPVSLYRDVRYAILFVGTSLSFGLICSSFASIFLGLQRYALPMVLLMVNRILFAAVVVIAAALHQSLAVMGALAAVANVTTGILHFAAWRRWGSQVRLSLRGLDLAIVKKMTRYCASLATWSVGMLCISGLDLTIVGAYDFGQTAYYSIATLPTAFIISITGAALAPFMPAASAYSVHRSAGEMGMLLSRVTRYASILLVVSGGVLLVGGYWILRVWVGPTYATHTIEYLHILVLANILRNVTIPYASMLVATENQSIAVGGVAAEAIVNLASSIYLARHIGAIGVAYGTLLGALVCVGVHFAVNVRYTATKIAISRMRLLLTGLLRPAAIAIPSVFLVPYWWFSPVPTFGLQAGLVWGLSTFLLAFLVGLNGEERSAIVGFIVRSLNLRTSYN